MESPKEFTTEEVLAALDAHGFSHPYLSLTKDAAKCAAALIRELQRELALWEATARRDMRNGVNREVETIRDRDARAAMSMFFGTPEGCAETAFRYADAMAKQRAKGPT